jgi:phosphatidylglycerophosphatase A
VRRVLLSLFGVGFVPVAPGTLASGVAILAYAGMLWAFDARAAGVACAGVALFFALVTVLVGGGAERDCGKRDPGWIVSDEVAGQLLAVMLAKWPVEMLAAFAGFRLLDIAKPFPIGRLQRLPGGWGILADDLAAGLVVLVALRLAGWLAPEWGLACL